jgi:uncharacterized protein
MKKASEIITLLKTLKGYMTDTYKVKEIGLFGSAARNSRTAGSDIDILVDFKRGADLFDLVGLGQFLEEKLRCRVDVVPKRALRKEIKKAVLQEVVTV